MIDKFIKKSLPIKVICFTKTMMMQNTHFEFSPMNPITYLYRDKHSMKSGNHSAHSINSSAVNAECKQETAEYFSERQSRKKS